MATNQASNAATPPEETDIHMRTAPRVRFNQQLGLLLALILLSAVLSLLAPNFLTAGNIVNVLRQMSMIAIIAVGMTMVITAGEIDLSAGSLVAFSGVFLATLAISWGWPLWLSLLATLLLGSAVGAFIGAIRVTFRIPSFIITLGLLTALRSGAFVLCNGFPISPFPAAFNWLGAGFIGPIPVPVVIMILTYVIGYVAFNHTPWGRAVYAVGGNEEASRLSGINTKAIKISVFMVTSTLAALAGSILASRLDSARRLWQPAGSWT